MIRTERVKLLATAFNNLGVGVILAGIVVPIVSGHQDDPVRISAWLAFGTDLILVAQAWLGRL